MLKAMAGCGRWVRVGAWHIRRSGSPSGLDIGACHAGPAQGLGTVLEGCWTLFIQLLFWLPSCSQGPGVRLLKHVSFLVSQRLKIREGLETSSNSNLLRFQCEFQGSEPYNSQEERNNGGDDGDSGGGGD